MSLKALIFDVDGTLADTEEAHRQAFEASFQANGVPWRWPASLYVDLLRVTGGKERLAHYVRSLDVPDAERARLQELVPLLHRTKTDRFAELVAKRRVPPRPGIARLVRDARAARLRLAIASTTTPTNVEALLPALLGAEGRRAFEVIVTGDVVTRKKPAPDIYELALSRLGLSAAECVVFEDSQPGVLAAKAAGIFAVAVPTRWTAAHDLSAADLVLPSLGDPDDPLDPASVALIGGKWLDLTNLALLHRGMTASIPATREEAHDAG
jgi:HAD superfamily hydrolase (TIGR01509 family)